MKKIIIGFVISVLIIFAACQKEEAEVSTSPPVDISGVYLGSYRKLSIGFTTVNSQTINGNAYAIVDTVRKDVYQFVICEDSLLMGTIYDTLQIRTGNDTLRACGEGISHFGHGLPGGVQHYVIIRVDCDTAKIERRYYPTSNNTGSGSVFSGVRLH